jgi:hypothetical protein
MLMHGGSMDPRMTRVRVHPAASPGSSAALESDYVSQYISHKSRHVLTEGWNFLKSLNNWTDDIC